MFETSYSSDFPLLTLLSELASPAYTKTQFEESERNRIEFEKLTVAEQETINKSHRAAMDNIITELLESQSADDAEYDAKEKQKHEALIAKLRGIFGN